MSLQSYEPRYYYWEVIEMLKKVFIACFGVLFFPDAAAQPVFVLLVTSVYTLMTVKLQPYLADSNDFAASFTNVGLWITSFYALLSQTEVLNAGQSSDIAIGTSSVCHGGVRRIVRSTALN